jgi:hypothetical protein
LLSGLKKAPLTSRCTRGGANESAQCNPRSKAMLKFVVYQFTQAFLKNEYLLNWVSGDSLKERIRYDLLHYSLTRGNFISELFGRNDY